MGTLLTDEEIEKLWLTKGYAWRIESYSDDELNVVNEYGDVVAFDLNMKTVRTVFGKSELGIDQGLAVIRILRKKK